MGNIIVQSEMTHTHYQETIVSYIKPSKEAQAQRMIGNR